jgi:hypothetical protein
MNDFTITPPEILKLPAPAKGTKVPYYDPSRELGERCVWTIEWIVFRDEEHTQHVKPQEWKFNNGSPDLEKLPNEFLFCELEDIMCRGGYPFAGMAAKLYFGYDDLRNFEPGGEGDGWRFNVIDLLQKSHGATIQRISPYNPPAKATLMHAAKARK